MQRIAIIGPSGAGKSTLARAMGHLLDLPVVHLDAHYWRSGWTPTPDHEWDETVRHLAAAERWIMDGNYSRTLVWRLERADTVIWLNMSRWLSLWRVVKRRIQYHGRTRPDLASDCPERLDLDLLRFLWTYHRRHASLRDRLHEYPVEVIELRSPRQVRAYVASMREGRGTAT